MAKKLPAGVHHGLSSALSTWRDWTSRPVTKPYVVAQLGGETNLSFRVSDGKSDWVIRLSSDLADDGRDLASELGAHQAACKMGIAPAITFSGNDFLVTEFKEGSKPGLEDLSQIGELFSRIHSLEIEIRPLDLTRHLQTYFDQASADPAITRCFDLLQAIPPQPGGHKVLCHHDLTLDNMIKTNSGLVAIDWEYCALSDPAFDLAVFTHTQKLDDDQMLRLLDQYHGNSDGLQRSVRYYELVYGMIEILWWRIRGNKLERKIARLEQQLGVWLR